MGRGRDVSNEPISQIEAHQLFDTVVEALKGVVEQVNEALLAQHKGLVDMADQMNKAFESRDELYAGKGLVVGPTSVKKVNHDEHGNISTIEEYSGLGPRP